MTVEEREALIERAMQRLAKLREREASLRVSTPEPRPRGVVTNSLLESERLLRERPDLKKALNFRFENIG